MGRGSGSWNSELGLDDNDDDDDDFPIVISSREGAGEGSPLGVYSKERSLLLASASSSFSSRPFGGPRLQRSVPYLTSASLNFLICFIKSSPLLQNLEIMIRTLTKEVSPNINTPTNGQKHHKQIRYLTHTLLIFGH